MTPRASEAVELVGPSHWRLWYDVCPRAEIWHCKCKGPREPSCLSKLPRHPNRSSAKCPPIPEQSESYCLLIYFICCCLWKATYSHKFICTLHLHLVYSPFVIEQINQAVPYIILQVTTPKSERHDTGEMYKKMTLRKLQEQVPEVCTHSLPSFRCRHSVNYFLCIGHHSVFLSLTVHWISKPV